MTAASEQAATTLPRRAILSDIRALGAMLFSDPRERWGLVVRVALLAASQLLVLHSLGEAMVEHRAGHPVVAEMSMFIAGAVVSVWLSAALRTQASRVVSRALPALVRQIADRVQDVDLETLDTIGALPIRRCMTADAARVLEIGTRYMWFVSEALFATIGFVYFCVYSAQAMILGLAVLTGATALLTASGLAVERWATAAESQKTRMFTAMGDLLKGIAQIKIHRPRSRAIAAQFNSDADEYARRQTGYYRSFFSNQALAQALLFGLLGAVVFVYARLFPDVSQQTDRLVLTAFYTFEPITMIFLDQLAIARGGEALRRMRAMLARLDDAAAVDTSAEAQGSPPSAFTQIELRAVSYTYPSRAVEAGFTMGPVELVIRPGELVFITGHNGSGKSTFLKLLTGLYALDGGEIWLDGHKLANPAPQRFRELFGTIASDFVLFPRLYGLAEPGPELARLLKEMQLDDKVAVVDGAFSTTDLSTGQRKRLAMIVELLRDRPLYVFDEWAADQDPQFRTVFYRDLLPALIARGKAVIAVTHDDDYFGVAKRRIHFQGGTATEIDPAEVA